MLHRVQQDGTPIAMQVTAIGDNQVLQRPILYRQMGRKKQGLYDHHVSKNFHVRSLQIAFSNSNNSFDMGSFRCDWGRAKSDSQ